MGAQSNFLSISSVVSTPSKNTSLLAKSSPGRHWHGYRTLKSARMLKRTSRSKSKPRKSLKNLRSQISMQTTKPNWRSVSAMPPPRSRHMSSSVLDRPITKSFVPPLDLVNTVYSSTCTLACRCPKVLATHSQSSDPRSVYPSLSFILHRS
jgi:hypothetical protein